MVYLSIYYTEPLVDILNYMWQNSSSSSSFLEFSPFSKLTHCHQLGDCPFYKNIRLVVGPLLNTYKFLPTPAASFFTTLGPVFNRLWDVSSFFP